MNKLLLFSVFSILTLNVMAQEKIVQTAGRDQLGTFAPKFAELNDDVLFGEVWSRTIPSAAIGNLAHIPGCCFISFFPVILHDNITNKDKTLRIVFIIIFYLFIVKLLITNLLR